MIKRPLSAAQPHRLIIKGPKDELIQARGQINELQEENKKQKTQIMQLKKQLSRYEHVDENLINSQQLLSRSSEQPSLIPSLKYKVRIQNAEIESLRHQMQLLQRQIKTTSIQELELQLQQYQEESIKLKGMLEEALDLGANQKRNKQIQYLQRIDELKQINAQLQLQLEQTNKEAKMMQSQFKKTQEQTNLNQQEKQKSEQRYVDQINLLKMQLQQYQTRIDQITQQQQPLNNHQDAYNDKDEQIYTLTDQMNKMRKEQLSKINSLQQYIEQQQTQISSKQSLIDNLHDEIRQLKSYIQTEKEQQILRSKNKSLQDVSTQATYGQSLELSLIKNQLKFKMRRGRVKQQDLPQYFSRNFTFQTVKDTLAGFPFNLSIEEAHETASYLLSTEESQNIKQKQIEADLPLGVFQSRLIHLLPSYEIISPDQEGILFKMLRQKLRAQMGSMGDVIKQIKKQEKSALPIGLATVQQFIEASKVVLDDSLTFKEADYLLQLTFETTGKTDFINLQKISDLFQSDDKSSEQTKSKNLTITQPVVLVKYQQEIVLKPRSNRTSILKSPVKQLKLKAAHNLVDISPQKTTKQMSVYRAQLGNFSFKKPRETQICQTDNPVMLDKGLSCVFSLQICALVIQESFIPVLKSQEKKSIEADEVEQLHQMKPQEIQISKDRQPTHHQRESTNIQEQVEQRPGAQPASSDTVTKLLIEERNEEALVKELLDEYFKTLLENNQDYVISEILDNYFQEMLNVAIKT